MSGDKYCSQPDYYLLTNLANLLTEINIERSSLLSTEEFFLQRILNLFQIISNQDSPNQISGSFQHHNFVGHFKENDQSINESTCNISESISKESIVIKSPLIKNEKVESDYIIERPSDLELLADKKIYNVQMFTIKLKSLIYNCGKFDSEFKINLLRNLSQCLFHYFLNSKDLHIKNKRCSYKLLFHLIDELEIVDFPFCLYVISDLNLCDYFTEILLELNSSTINSIITLYFEISDQKLDNIFELKLFKNEQIFSLNITFMIILIEVLFQIKNDSQIFDEYLSKFKNLINSVQKFNQISIDNAIYEFLRLYNFLIEKFLGCLIEVSSKLTSLYSKYTIGQQLLSFYVSPFQIEGENFLKVFEICYNLVRDIFESKKFDKKLSQDPPFDSIDKILIIQQKIKQMICVWKCMKTYFKKCNFDLSFHEFVPDNRLKITDEMDFVFNYLNSQKNGYLFLAYCFIKSEKIEIVKNVLTNLKTSILIHPKLIYLLAERAFAEKEKGLFLIEIFQKLVIDLDDEIAIRVYIHFHFEHFFFNKLATIDMTKKPEILNRADTSTIKIVKKELIKLVLVDPLQVLSYLINFSVLSNRVLFELICELLCKEFKPHCMYKITVGKYTCNFLTALINLKIKTFEYCYLETLCFFLKYTMFYSKTNEINGLIELENLILVIIQNENLVNFELAKKKLYFLQTVIDLCEIFNVKFIEISNQYPPLFIYILQMINIFWNETEIKAYALNLLYFFKNNSIQLSEYDQIWLKSKISCNSYRKTSLFYLDDLFDNNLNDIINMENLNELLYLNSISEKYDYAYSYLNNASLNNELTVETKKTIEKFISDNSDILTREEHFNLFNLLIGYLSISDLLISYVKKACECRMKYIFEIVHYIVKNSLFRKKSKLLNILHSDSKLFDQIKIFYDYLVKQQQTVAMFYDESKFENFIIQIAKFISMNCKDSNNILEYQKILHEVTK